MICSLFQSSFVDLQCMTLKKILFANPPKIAFTSLELSLQSFFVVVFKGEVFGTS
jgi:hypothetical protein